jgi:ABC-type polysaccharide/polyol phosphate transport system ATPase subunit
MAYIELQNVSLKFPMTFQERSFRTELFNKLLKKDQKFEFKSGIENITMKLEDGDRLGILGLNGSGKTTLLKILAGVYKPDTGEVKINGKVLSMISMTSGLDMESNGIENIYNISYLRGIKKREIEKKIKDIIEFSELGTSIYKPVRTYSSGMLSRLSASLLLNFDCEILLLDEFISTGDKYFKEKIRQKVLKKIQDTNIFVFASHDENLIDQICNKKIEMSFGKITAIK